jgi:hypothetical protein
MAESLKIIFQSPRNPTSKNENKEVIPVFSIAEQKFPRYFEKYLKIFPGMSKFVFIYSTISRETPNDVVRNPGWETLHKSKASTCIR